MDNGFRMKRRRRRPQRPVPQGGRYRACASVVVLRPSNVCSPACPAEPGGRSGEGCETIYQVLLLRKPRKRDAWQLPQGGLEAGETLEVAALRELREEAGIEAQVVGTSGRTYQYDFPASYRRFRPDDVCGQRIAYVFALGTNEPIQVDGKEIDAYVWATLEELPRYIKRKEYLEIVLALLREGAEKLR